MHSQTSNMTRISAPLKWHGGKHYLAKWIIEQMPAHTHYVEPYFGGGQVLFQKPHEGTSEVINDINQELTNFWRCLRDQPAFGKLQSLLSDTEVSKLLWDEVVEKSKEYLEGNLDADSITRAWWFFIRYRQSRQGLGTSFCTTSKTRVRRGMNEQVSSWWSAIAGLDEAHRRLSKVLIYGENALDVIRREDSKVTFFYLDPPYVHGTRTATSAFEHEMADPDHERLCRCLASIKGKFLLSGYNNAIYAKFERNHQWLRAEKKTPNHSSSEGTKEEKTEVLWRNY